MTVAVGRTRIVHRPTGRVRVGDLRFFRDPDEHLLEISEHQRGD